MVRAIWRLLTDSCTEWDRDNASSLAASLAFYSVLALAPASIVVIAVLGLILGEQAAEGQIVTQVRALIGEDGAATIQAVIRHATPPRAGAGATILGAVTLVLGVSGVFAELRDSLTFIWGPGGRPTGGLLWLLRYRLVSFTMIFGVGLLLLISIAASAGVDVLCTALQLSGGWLAFAAQATTLVFSCGVTFVLFAVFHKVLPEAEVAWRDVWLGAGVTALLFSLGRLLIGLYLGWSNVTTAYGAAGSLLALLLWVYYSAQILFFGAELTKVWARDHGRCPESPRRSARPGRERG